MRTRVNLVRIFLYIYNTGYCRLSTLCRRTMRAVGDLYCEIEPDVPVTTLMLEKFITYIESERRYSPLTVRNYRHDVECFLAWMQARRADLGEPFDSEQDMASITTDDIRDWMLHRTEQANLSAGSLNREVSSLRALFRYLQREGVVKRNIFVGITSAKRGQHLPQFVPESRMADVVDQCREESVSADFRQVRDSLIVLMFYACGLRLAELVGIDTDAFSDDYRSLRVRGKGDKERIVPIVEPVARSIKRYLAIISEQNICIYPEKALFLTHKGERISRSVVYRLVKSELERSGVQGKKSPHVLRHTFATALMNSGADLREIQELLGHSSLRATQVYTHNSIAKLQAVYSTAHPHQKVAEAEPKEGED